MATAATSAASAADFHDIISRCVKLEKQNATRLRDVGQYAAGLVGLDPAYVYTVEVSKPGNLGKQLEQSQRARTALLAVAILDQNSDYTVEDYESAAQALVLSSEIAVRTIAAVERREGTWQLRMIVAADGAPEPRALLALAPAARLVIAGAKMLEGTNAAGSGQPETDTSRLLDERLRPILLKLHSEMLAANELKDLDTLRTYYAVFRERFGPGHLASLSGETLLETMHNHSTRQSLVYWLEFKNDPEFPAIFGSIAGGSAGKFGVYKRKANAAWAIQGEGGSPKEISLEAAIEIATLHRDQLLRAVELLERLPTDAQEADYLDLEKALSAAAPDVANTAWGHKYLHLLFPEKLDDYHVFTYQRYHLLRLLQPEPKTEGRYSSAWRYVAIARELDMVLNHLTSVLNRRHGSPRGYWRIGTSDRTSPRNRWDLMRTSSVAAVGWPRVGSIGGLREAKNARDEVRRLIAEHYPADASMVSRKAGELTAFLAKIADGDVVCASDGATVLGIGIVRGSYTYAPDVDFPHQRAVDWVALKEWRLETGEGNQTTVWQYKNYASLLQIERVLLDAASEPRERTVAASGGSATLRRQTAVPLSGIPRRIEQILDRKGQVILYGPPGTGKTYYAMLTAQEIVARRVYGRAFAELSASEQRIIDGDSTEPGLVRVATFHPEFGYEAFIEGYQPVVKERRLAYERRDGVFKGLCDAAGRNPTKPYVLVIDEINRGDIPRIFGELLTLLERDKRGRAVQLPLTGASFSVPRNVYVIGTMNTADRSIALLDVALRRRFGFVALMPDYSALGSTVVAGLPLAQWLKWVNARVRQLVGADGRHREIGHGYLWSKGAPVTDPITLAAILRDDIVPLLEEYCFEDLSHLEKIVGELVDVEAQRVRYEVFDGDAEAAVAVLLAAAPELMSEPPESPEEPLPDVDDGADDFTDAVEA